MDTVLVLGDQLNRGIGALATADPSTHRVLLVESEWKTSRPFHRQRLHLVLTAMRRCADALRAEGFEVDHRRSRNLATGVAEHRAELGPARVIATEPLSRRSERHLAGAGVEFVRSNQFLCHRAEFAEWAGDRNSLRMEDFYRWQRRRLGYLMDGDEPAGGRWNFDAENREPPPADGSWPEPVRDPLDDLDRDVLESLPGSAFGDDPEGWWPTSRERAIARLDHFVEHVLPVFGPHEDAMTERSWHLAHSLLSPALNIGLLLPGEVCDRVEDAYRAGVVPIASAEGFIRQVIGWREYVWGLYWLWPDMAGGNALDHDAPLPPAFRGAPTDMRCLAHAAAGVRSRAWSHHIQRLMIFTNLANLLGVDPDAVYEWMATSFVDAAEWVMVPNVYGMGLWADGGRMATKPYVSGGAYINRMSDHCGDCRFDPKVRVGPDACPFASLYWDFLARHRATLGANARMGRVLGGIDRLKDLDATLVRAAEVKRLLAEGDL